MSCRTHCCKRHGCKYGKDACSVEAGAEEQEFPCESCTEESHIVIASYHHWMGSGLIPDEVRNLVKTKGGYFLPMDVLLLLMTFFDVQIFHNEHGRNLMLDHCAGKHRQR